MFNFETEYIIRKVQNKILGERDRVTLRSILSAPIHNAIKVYFRASIANKHGSTKRFHTEQSADVDILKSEIDLLLPSNYTFDRDAFLSLLTDAVHFQFNYLCRPRWTMKEFFFHNSSTLAIPELKQGFIYFSAYDYYPKVLFPYLRKKNITQLENATFDEIILKIDKLVLGNATANDFATVLQPLSDFIRYGRENDDDSIPEHALALFFDDKKFNHIKTYFESILKRKQIEQVTIDELREYLSGMPEKGDIKSEEAITEKPVDEKIPDDESGAPPVIEEPYEEEPDAEEPIAEINNESGTGPEKEVTKTSESNEPFQPLRAESDPADESLEEIKEIKPQKTSSSMPPLELLIEDDERKRFIRKLFNNDAAYFEVVVQTLNKILSWKEASLYIDEIFLVNGVDPYSTDAVNFTDKVYTRFNQKSVYK